MATTGGNALFVDTNILIYATDSRSPLQQQARGALHDAQRAGTELVVSAQVIQEYFAAATRQGVTTGQPPLATMMINVRSFRRSFRVVYPSPQTLNRLITLLQTIPAAGKQVHDTNIVATMQVYRIPRLLTHNVADFTRFGALISIVPLVPTP